MSLVDDHLHIVYDTEFESDDLIDMDDKMREHIKPQFSEQTEHMRDVQVVLDENYINYIFFNLFYREK